MTVAKNWRDEYRYDDHGRLAGWTRTRGEDKQEFTPDGALVTEKDAQGRATKARTVIYLAAPRKEQPPLLEQQFGDEIFTYGYSSKDDLVGRIQSRTEAIPSAGDSPEKR